MQYKTCLSIAERERFIQPALKKGSSIKYVSENRIFTDADDYSMEIELQLADCPQNIAIFVPGTNFMKSAIEVMRFLLDDE